MALPKKMVPVAVDLSHLAYDSTERVEYLKREGTLRGTELYLSAGLVADMEEEWKTNLLAVKTVTDRKNYQVYVFKADPEDEGEVVHVRKTDTLAAATISFFIPLQLLSLKLAKGSHVKLEPTVVDAGGDKGVGYCFDLRSIRAKKKKATHAAPGQSGDSASS